MGSASASVAGSKAPSKVVSPARTSLANAPPRITLTHEEDAEVKGSLVVRSVSDRECCCTYCVLLCNVSVVLSTVRFRETVRKLFACGSGKCRVKQLTIPLEHNTANVSCSSFALSYSTISSFTTGALLVVWFFVPLEEVHCISSTCRSETGASDVSVRPPPARTVSKPPECEIYIRSASA